MGHDANSDTPAQGGESPIAHAPTQRIVRPNKEADMQRWMRYDDPRFWRDMGERALGDRDGELALCCWMRVRDLEPDARDVDFQVAQSLLLLGEPMHAYKTAEDLAANPAASERLREQARKLVAHLEPLDPTRPE